MARKTTKPVILTTRLSQSLSRKIDNYAKRVKQTRSTVVQDILSRHIDDEIAFVEAVSVGLRQLEAGLGLPHEEAMRQVQAFIAARKRERRKAA